MVKVRVRIRNRGRSHRQHSQRPHHEILQSPCIHELLLRLSELFNNRLFRAGTRRRVRRLGDPLPATVRLQHRHSVRTIGIDLFRLLPRLQRHLDSDNVEPISQHPNPAARNTSRAAPASEPVIPLRLSLGLL